jgi:hypothetical protein
MSIASIGETLENPSVTQIMAAYPTKKIFDDAVKAGKIKPTREVGIVSNIFNRVVQSALSEQAQAQAQTTVLQDNTQPMGLAAAAQMPQQPRGQGLNQVPVPQQMFERQGMASGGIVAFQAGGSSQAPTFSGFLDRNFGESQRPMPYTAPRPELTAEELKEYERLKNLGLLDSAKETADKLGVGLQDFIKNIVSTQKKAVESVVDPVMDYFSQSKSLRETLSPKPPMPQEPGYVPQASAASAGMIDQFSGTETFGGDPGLAAAAAIRPSTAGPATTTSSTTQQAAAQQAAAQQAAAQQAAAQQAAAQPAAAQPAAIQPPVTEKVPEKRTMEQLIAERTGLYGEDPRKAAMKAALEKSGKESESDRILESLRLISAGEEKRTKGTTKELESLLADRAKKKAAAEQRAYKAADIEGMDYDTRRKAIDSILGEQREEAKTKEERKFRENLLTKELTARENLNKEDIIARKEVARIAADGRPEQVMSKLFDIFRNGSPADKAAVSDFLTLQKGDLLSRLGGASGPDIKDAIAKYNIEPTR